MKRQDFLKNEMPHKGYLPPAIESGQVWQVIDYMREPYIGQTNADRRYYIKDMDLKKAVIINGPGRSPKEWDVSFMSPKEHSTFSRAISKHKRKTTHPSTYLMQEDIYQYCSFVA